MDKGEGQRSLGIRREKNNQIHRGKQVKLNFKASYGTRAAHTIRLLLLDIKMLEFGSMEDG